MKSDVTREYARRFAQLRTDKSRARWTGITNDRAPHKPLLLLSVLDLFEQGAIESNLIEITPELGESFSRYYMAVLPRERRGNLALPFFHLRGEGFWRLLPKSGKEEVVEANSQIRSMSQLQETVVGARLEDSLYDLLRAQEPREFLRSVLVETYFAPEARSALIEQGAINQEAFLYSKKLLARRRDQAVRETLEEDHAYRTAARDQGFRRAVVTVYAHCCALCGIRVRTLDGHTAVDAAHIVPWSVGHDDRPANGLALCRTCHWAFDEGLIGVSGGHEILASGQLRAVDNLPGYLSDLKGNVIARPEEEAYWPDPGSLRWHQEHVFILT